MNLDLWDCFGREKLQSYNQRNTVIQSTMELSYFLKVIFDCDGMFIIITPKCIKAKDKILFPDKNCQKIAVTVLI